MFYESDLSAEPCLEIRTRDIVCVGVSRPGSAHNGLPDRWVPRPPNAAAASHLSAASLRFRYSFGLYLSSEKHYHFGVDTAEALHSWTRSIGKVCPRPAVSHLDLQQSLTAVSPPPGLHAPQLPLSADARV